MKLIILSIVAASLILIALIALAQNSQDQVIKLDGTSVTGHLDAVDETSVIINNNAIARSQVKTIVFSGATVSQNSPGTPIDSNQTNLTDAVVKRLDGISYGHVSQVTADIVVQNGNDLPRAAVLSIAFNVKFPGVIITVIPLPSPSPDASASPTPSPSPSPGSDTSADEGGSSKGQPTPGSGGSTGPTGVDRTKTDRPPPPWLGDCGDKSEDIETVFNSCDYEGKYTESGPPGKLRCTLVVHYCGGQFRRDKIVPANNGDQAMQQLREELGVGKTKICCDKLRQARQSKKPCDPGIDLDCDGVPNQDDDFPFDPNRSRRPDQKRRN